MTCPLVGGDNTRVLAIELPPVEADKHSEVINILLAESMLSTGDVSVHG